VALHEIGQSQESELSRHRRPGQAEADCELRGPPRSDGELRDQPTSSRIREKGQSGAVPRRHGRTMPAASYVAIAGPMLVTAPRAGGSAGSRSATGRERASRRPGACG
jgi:hypothetical protein